MRIGEVASEAGVGVETIRFYERKGLIDRPHRPAHGGFRSYGLATVSRIRFIRQAQDLGFSLSEIVELLSLRADPSTDCADVRERARTKREEMEAKIAKLGRMRDALGRLIDACPGRGALGDCSIVEALETPVDGALRGKTKET